MTRLARPGSTPVGRRSRPDGRLSKGRRANREGGERHRATGSRTRTPRSPQVDRLVDDLAPPLRAIVLNLRRLIGTAAPELREVLKWGVPVWVGERNVVCIMIYTDHVNLGFFQGVKLSESHPEIEGTGKALRHVKIHSLRHPSPSHLAPIIRRAAALDRAS